MSRSLCATWYEGTAQLLSLTEFKSYLFDLYFIGWTIKRRREFQTVGPKTERSFSNEELSAETCHEMAASWRESMDKEECLEQKRGALEQH